MIFSDFTQIWGFFNFYKVGYWYFDKHCMESANHFELYGNFNNINMPDYEHGNSSAFFVSLISFTSDL